MQLEWEAFVNVNKSCEATEQFCTVRFYWIFVDHCSYCMFSVHRYSSRKRFCCQVSLGLSRGFFNMLSNMWIPLGLGVVLSFLIIWPQNAFFFFFEKHFIRTVYHGAHCFLISSAVTSVCSGLIIIISTNLNLHSPFESHVGSQIEIPSIRLGIAGSVIILSVIIQVISLKYSVVS